MKAHLRFPLLLALSLIIVGCQSKAPPPPSGPPKAEVKAKAGDLLKDYGGNALAADGKYKGKVVEVTGKFNSVQKAIGIGYVVQLAAEDAPEVNLSFVQCPIVEQAKDEVAKIQEGQMITLVGTCDGQVAGQVKLSKCWVVKPSADTAKK
jgi:hypothetical protein